MTGARKWLLRGGIALVSVAAAVLILELVLGRRTASDDGAAFFADAPDDLDVPYVLAPDAEVVFDGHYVKIPPTTVAISSPGLRAARD